MHILIGYGYYPYTTGTYFEKNLAADHQVTFVGTARADRAGYPPDVDIAELAAQLKPAPDLFLYIDSGHLSYLPRNLHRLPCPTCPKKPHHAHWAKPTWTPWWRNSCKRRVAPMPWASKPSSCTRRTAT